MNSPNLLLALGVVLGLVAIPVLSFLFRLVTVEVDDEEAVLVTRFGKLDQRLVEPGLHFFPGRILPWVRLRHASLRRDFRHFRDVHVNDARGTSVIVDLWVELKVADPVKALFQVEDWDRSLQNLVAHAATSILGNLEFQHILCDRTELGDELQRDISTETARWGIEIERVFIRKVSLLPEVSRQIFEAVAAKLERAKAQVEELGRLEVAKLEADTNVEVATLVATAKGQYPAAVGRGLAKLGEDKEVLDAYNELYSLSLIRPHRTIAFRGFRPGELSAVEAGFLSPAQEGAAPPAGIRPLTGMGETVRER